MNTTRTNSSTKSNKATSNIATSPTVGGEFPPLRDDRRVLALETSQHELSICLTHDGEIDFDLTLTECKQQAERLTALVDRCLSEAGILPADIEVGLFSRGPGRFTAIRIALGFFIALRSVHDTSIVGVSSLAALASRAYDEARRAPPNPTSGRDVLVVQDARGGEMYVGAYRVACDEIFCLMADTLLSPDRLPIAAQRLFKRVVGDPDALLAGAGWRVFDKVLDRYFDNQALSTRLSAIHLTEFSEARDLYQVAKKNGCTRDGVVDGKNLAPVYLRDGL